MFLDFMNARPDAELQLNAPIVTTAPSIRADGDAELGAIDYSQVRFKSPQASYLHSPCLKFAWHIGFSSFEFLTNTTLYSNVVFVFIFVSHY